MQCSCSYLRLSRLSATAIYADTCTDRMQEPTLTALIFVVMWNLLPSNCLFSFVQSQSKDVILKLLRYSSLGEASENILINKLASSLQFYLLVWVARTTGWQSEKPTCEDNLLHFLGIYIWVHLSVVISLLTGETTFTSFTLGISKFLLY